MRDMQAFLFLAACLVVVVGATAFCVAAAHNLGRSCGRRPARRAWIVLGEACLAVAALLPSAAVLAMTSLVVRARLMTGDWPRLGPPRWIGVFEYVHEGFRAAELPVHQALVVWIWLLASVSPLTCMLPQAFLVGLGRPPRWRLLGWLVASWLAWIVLGVLDPGGFVDWLGDS
jgi:hypothetical protein